MKVIGYVRVSTEEQANEGQSLGNQRSKLSQYATLYDIELVDVVEDAGVSAKSLDRPGLRRALARIRGGEAEGLLIAKLDRLTRHVADWNSLIEGYFSERAGKRLFSVADAIDTRTAAGRMVLNMLVTVAQWEREIIAERTREALQHKITKGERLGRTRYGYQLVQIGQTPKGKPIYQEAEDPRQQAGLRRMRELRDAGLPFRAIGAKLGEEGFATKDGKPWQAATIKNILGRRG
ncbi:MAG TPA: recombinase family protein [Pirellulales bacterium]|nr:recombinase family protein [Pirellulales bacterium]